MSLSAPTELIFVRHAPVAEQGRLFGRTDVPIDEPNMATISGLREILPAESNFALFSSPAKRCQQTCRALFPTRQSTLIDAFWEQDFGRHEGRAYGEIPDIGNSTASRLAAYCPPDGESFDDLATRVATGLQKIAQGRHERAVIVAHAGVIRAALGLALGQLPAGLTFMIDHLSMTRLIMYAPGEFAIAAVNVRADHSRSDYV